MCSFARHLAVAWVVEEGTQKCYCKTYVSPYRKRWSGWLVTSVGGLTGWVQDRLETWVGERSRQSLTG